MVLEDSGRVEEGEELITRIITQRLLHLLYTFSQFKYEKLMATFLFRTSSSSPYHLSDVPRRMQYEHGEVQLSGCCRVCVPQGVVHVRMKTDYGKRGRPTAWLICLPAVQNRLLVYLV